MVTSLQRDNYVGSLGSGIFLEWHWPTLRCRKTLIIVGPDRELISAGFNGLPRGIEDSTERLYNREVKLSLTVHAEMNAILAAARHGIRTKNCSMYIAAKSSQDIWGGPPCISCTVEIIQAGIIEIISYNINKIPSAWEDSLAQARQILKEARINYREVTYAFES